MNNPRRGVIYSLIISFASVIVVSLGGIFYTNHVDRESNQKLCVMIVAVDDAFKDTAPTAPSGLKVADAFHRLRNDLEC
jgi:hypothetical protein